MGGADRRSRKSELTHVDSDTLGRNSSESDMSQAAWFINSFQSCPQSLSLYCLSGSFCFPAVSGLVWEQAYCGPALKLAHYICLVCASTIAIAHPVPRSRFDIF